MFSVHTTTGGIKNVTIATYFGFVFEKMSVREITWLSLGHHFQKVSLSKCFFVYTKRKSRLPDILDLCLKKSRSGKSRDCRWVIVFKTLRCQNVFFPRENEKQATSFRNNWIQNISMTDKLDSANGLFWFWLSSEFFIQLFPNWTACTPVAYY